MAAEYQEHFGEHAYDESGNYVGPSGEIDEAWAEYYEEHGLDPATGQPKVQEPEPEPEGIGNGAMAAALAEAGLTEEPAAAAEEPAVAADAEPAAEAAPEAEEPGTEE